MLHPGDAIELVRRCRERGIEVLGVDGFRLTERTTQPVMEQSIDLSGLEDLRRRSACWDRAEEFLLQRSTSDLFFKVVYKEP
jgi:hypothetical protein